MANWSSMRHALYFTAPYKLAVQAEPIPSPGPRQLLVETAVSAISAGTELLLYRGQMPAEMALDETIAGLQSEIRYPLPYGYAAVGRVSAIGPAVDTAWLGRMVFAFAPHASHFVADVAAAQPVPPKITAEDAAFLPNMETAVSFLMDGRPVIGERVAVFGQGVVGLLTTALLARLPLAHLTAVDAIAGRRAQALSWGAHEVLDPNDPASGAQLAALDADLCFELSGNPAALNLALMATGFDGRILIGSWYGRKQAPIDLGGKFHRSHIRLISSQVSQLNPRWRGRWDKDRRLQTAWRMLATLRPSQLITQRLPLTEAPAAYRLLDKEPEQALQVVFEYGRC